MGQIFEGALTPQDIFNINVDTQARWDKITSVKPDFDVPSPNFPEYNFDSNPLDRDSQMTIYDGLFSDDPVIKGLATDAISKNIDKRPEMKYNTGFHIDTPYDQAKKYVNRDWGFDPTRDNEDFYHKTEYANKSLPGKVWDNTYKGLGRFVGSVAMKLGQTLGHLGGMIWGGGENALDAITGKDNHSFMETMAENAFVKWFEQAEETIKDQWMPVFKPSNWDEKGFWSKLGSGQYWSDELADGAAFMGAMIAETYLMAGAGRAAGLGGLGAKTITGSGKLAKLGRGAMKFTTGADDLGGMATWALSVAGESAFEASGMYKNVKQELREEREVGKNNYTDEEIDRIAGERAAQSFKGNMLVLSLSNAFENRMIFQPLMKRFRGRKDIEFEGDKNRIASGTRISDDITTKDNLLKAESARPKYAEGFKGRLEGYWNLGKKLKDPQGALRFYGSKAIKATAMEGYWEENAQLAIERLAHSGHLNTESFINQYVDQTINATFGDDNQASESIGAGMVIGILGSAGTSAAIRERKKLKEATKDAIEKYNNIREAYLSLGDIYERDENNNLIKDEENGGYKINKEKTEAFIAGLNEHVQIQETADNLEDPILRAVVQEKLLSRFVGAAKRAGIDRTVATRINNLSSLSAKQVTDLGFDPTSVENIQEFQNNFAEQSKIYDETFLSKRDVQKPKGVKQDEFDKTNIERKIDLYSAATMMRAYQRAAEKYNQLGVDNDIREGRVGSNPFSLLVSAQYQLQKLVEFMEKTPESGFYKDYFEKRFFELRDAITKHRDMIATIQETEGTGELNGSSVMHSDYAEFVDEKGQFKSEEAEKAAMEKFKNDQIESAKHGELQNIISQYKYIKEKLSDPKDGYNNYLEYKKYEDTIKKIDKSVDKAENPQPEDILGKDEKISDEAREQKRNERKGKKDYENRTPWVKKGTNATKLYKLKDDNRISEDLYAYYAIQPMGVGNLKEMVQKMIDNPYTHPYLAEAFAKILPHIPDNATVKFDNQQTFAPGFYETGTNQIVIDPDIVDHTSMSFEGVMLHELIHLLTSDELNQDGYFAREMETLFEETKKELEDRGVDIAYYGFSNVHEFLAEAYSNPEFQAVLMQVKSKYGQKSAWDKFIDILSQFLKDVLGIDMKPSRLDDIFMNVEELLNDTVYEEAVKQLKAKGMTEEDLAPYSKREIINLAEKEGLIDLGQPQQLPPPKVADTLQSLKAKIKDHIIAQVRKTPDVNVDNFIKALEQDNWLELFKPRLSIIYDDNPKGLAELEALIEEYVKLKNAEVIKLNESKTVLDKLKDIWNSIGNTKGRSALEDGWAESHQYLDEALKVGAENYSAHGMGKSSFGSALSDLFNLMQNGIDPNRGGGRLYTAPLATAIRGTGAATGTASGNAYMDGAFVLVAKPGVDGITSIDDIAGILVNSGLTDLNDQIIPLLREAFPNLIIESYKNTKSLVEQLNKKFPKEEEVEITPEQQVQEWLDKNMVPKAFISAAKSDPNGFLVFVASQAQNVAEDLTTPLQGDVRQATIDLFGEDIVNYAVALHPVEGKKPESLSEQSLEALKEAFMLHEQSIIEGKTYEEVLEERGITKKGNNIDLITDIAKGEGGVAAPTGHPNEINEDGVSLNVAENEARLARFNFLQKLSDTNNREGYKLKVFVQEKNGKLLLKGKVVDRDGNPIAFDVNGKQAKGADTYLIIFDIDLKSYEDGSLHKPRLIASGLLQNPLETALFNLDDSFKDKDGNPLANVNVRIIEYLKDIIEKEPVYAEILDVLQGHLMRPGVTNKKTSLTQHNAPRRTLAELQKEDHIYDNDNGSIRPKTQVDNNTYVRGGTLNVKLKRNVNTDSTQEGFELVEFRNNLLKDMVDHKGKPLVDMIRPILEKAVKGELSSQGNYEQLLKTLLNKRGFLVLNLGHSILVINEKKFTDYFKQYIGKDISNIETLQNADLLKDEILALTTVDEILEAEMNIDKNLYETEDNLAAYINQFPPEFREFILNYKDIVKNNVTTSAIPVKVSDERTGYSRVNKRLVVSLDKTFQDMKNDVAKQEQEQISNPDDKNIKGVHNIDVDELFNTLVSEEEVNREDLTKTDC